MMRYSTEPRDQIFIKDYGFLSFAKNISKKIGGSISKNLSSKYSQKMLDHLKTKNIEDDKEMLKEMYISPEKRQQIIEDLRLI